jgi:UDP-N-acetylmuramyl tripeptide synthase
VNWEKRNACSMNCKGKGVTAPADRRFARGAPGDVFVAYPGARADGRRFIADAVARGAAAVLWEAGIKARVGAGGNNDVPMVAVDDLQALSGWIAHLVYGRPSEKLWTVGVTGTNGKTSVSQWIAQAFEALGRRCAVVGTLGNGFPGSLEESPQHHAGCAHAACASGRLSRAAARRRRRWKSPRSASIRAA